MKEGGTVGFGGNQTGKIIGTGTIGNSSVSINNVWFVDGLRNNLLNISQFCDNGYDVLFNKNNCTIINTVDQSVVFKGKRKNNVYKINFSELTDQKLVLRPYMDANMDWLQLMITVDGVGLSFSNLNMIHMMCLQNSVFKSDLKKN